MLAALVVVWQLTRYPAGKRLASMLAVVVPLIRRDGVLDVDDETAAWHRNEGRSIWGRNHTKPGTRIDDLLRQLERLAIFSPRLR